MSLTNLTTKTPYAGNGVTTVFPFTFKVFQAADLVVTETTAAGVTTTLILNTDYTVTGAGLDAGGSITRASAPPTGTTGLIRRVMPLTQTADIRNQSAFYASVHEDVFDKLTMVDQQQEEEIGRSVQLPEQFSSGVSTQLPMPMPGTAIGWNATGNGLDNLLIPGVTPGYVASFKGRIGDVLPALNDYSFSLISGTAAVGQIPGLPASQITSGQLALAQGGTNADLSATGGPSRFLKQNGAGAAVTVVQPAFTDLSGSATTAQIATALTAPGPIGGTTASTISGTTITATTQFTGPGTGLTGTAASLNIGGTAATATNATQLGGVGAVAYAQLAVRNTWTKSQVVSQVTLPPGTTVPVDASLSDNFTLTPAQNFTLANPTNLIPGQTLNIHIIQDATGSRVITYGSLYKFATGANKVLSTAANAVDHLSGYYDGNIITCSLLTGIS